MTGRFLVFEGLDGSGKTTQMARLEKWLTSAGVAVETTCEPTGGRIGTLIRQMLAGRIAVDQRTLAALFTADRTDHLVTPDTGVKTLKEKGYVVLCHRYYFSSYAYHARYVDMDRIIDLNAMNADILRPDLTLFIDVAPETCVARIKSRREHLEMYEKIDVLRQVRDHYFTAFHQLKDQENVVVVDGKAPPEEVEARIQQHVIPMLATAVF